MRQIYDTSSMREELMDRGAPFEREKEREGIRDVLIEQYMLHEVVHHAPLIDRSGVSPIKIPKVHSISDVYKCLHQGTFGVGHSIRDPKDFKNRLLGEMRMVEADSSEPLFERVSPDGSIVRVNLRPLRAAFIHEEEKSSVYLAQACLESAEMETGSAIRFFAALEIFRELNNAGELKVAGMTFAFPQHMVSGFLSEIRSFVSDSGIIPVLSHSPVFRSFNHPSYRVVHLQALIHSPLAFLIENNVIAQ